MDLKTQIIADIQQNIPGAEVQLEDPRGDGIHLQAIVISSAFEGLSRVKQHQLVMRALTEHFASELHAFALKTYTPKQWSESHE